MSFVRRKRIKGREYLYEVENSWNGGQVRQKVLRYLGPVEPLRKRRVGEKSSDRPASS
jgi:hypothetical protein